MLLPLIWMYVNINLSTNAEKQTRYIQHDNFFCFNRYVSNLYQNDVII
jgi:hypothetical protein